MKIKKVQTRAVILIHDVYELQNMSKELNASYALADDINATITRMWNGGPGFLPIGNSSAKFNGTFNGNGQNIINLWINRSSENDEVLFGCTMKYGVIENVVAVNAPLSHRKGMICRPRQAELCRSLLCG